MEKVAFMLRGKRRERKFSTHKAAREFIRLAVEKFGEDFFVAPSPESLASSMQAVESPGVGSTGTSCGDA